jgi:hypothetical protein
MNNQAAKLLEQHFDTAFAAPDGITRLRELILTLAIQGKLVEQDPKDLPASELLNEIEAEKLRLVKAGKIKLSKPLPHWYTHDCLDAVTGEEGRYRAVLMEVAVSGKNRQRRRNRYRIPGGSVQKAGRRSSTTIML